MQKRLIALFLAVVALTVGFLVVLLSGSAPITSLTTSPTPPQTPTPVSPTYSPAPTPTAPKADSPQSYTYTIINTYPHDTSAFTEGLVFYDGVLYESTGNYGSSTLRQVNLNSGTLAKEVASPSQYFAEGLAVVDNSLIQLTWKEHVGFIYDRTTFALVRNFSYASEGWGLTYDGTHLIMSDGSSKLSFLDPTTFGKIGEVSVHDGNNPVVNINELEYINGTVYANIWLTQKIAKINPETGQVTGWIDLSGIYQSSNLDSVLNGIAYDSTTARLFVTGKNWSNLYQIEINKK